ncbi:DNA polymerase III subunit alpha [Hutsoniella sourekii]
MLLNTQTVYSLLASTVTLEEYIKKAKELGYLSLGIADKEVLHGALEFYRLCQKYGMHALIGMRLELAGLVKQDQSYSFLLYARSYSGYQALMQISYLLNSSNRSSHQIWQLIQRSHGDLVYVSLGKESELEQALIRQDIQLAHQIEEALVNLFGQDGTYLGITAYPANNLELSHISDYLKQSDLTPVMAQPLNTLSSDQQTSLNVLQAIRDNRTLDWSAMAMRGPYTLYSPDELRALYGQINFSQAWDNTLKLSKTLVIDLPLDRELLPKFPVPSGYDSKTYLAHLTYQTMEDLGLDSQDKYVLQLEHELAIIDQMGFNDYFLIVWEIIDYCHQNNIRIGPGRGSAAGSLVSYLLKITGVDPIQYDLLFERFLNPERYSMPDIDIDIPDNRRDQVINYVVKRYGYHQVAQIATFGTFGAKQAIRDSLRVLGAGNQTLKAWSSSILSDANQVMTLARAYRESTALRQIVTANSENQEIFKIAQTIEGLPRHISTHAAAVVIYDQPLVETIPVMERKDGGDQALMTQFSMYDVEAVGLLKMDFLGLRNLTILDEALTTIKKQTGQEIAIESINKNDSSVLELFQKGDTIGVFQFESDGIRRVLRKLKPESFEDIVAVNALYRPGPMQQIDHFIDRKHGREKITYVHSSLEPILKNTYGIIVYQEQVMQILVRMGGFSLGEADLVRRAMSKKQADVMEAQRDHFIQGALARGYSQSEAEEVFDYIYAFSNYGFNRAHAVVYSTLAYQLAYLKVYYPAFFFKSLLNNTDGRSSKFQANVQQAKRWVKQLLPVDINRSLMTFSIDGQGLRIGLESVRGLRRELIGHIIDDRQLIGPYKDFIEFLRRLPDKFQKAEMIQPLIHAGAFDSFGYNRRTLDFNLDTLVQSIQFAGNSMSLFEEMEPKIELVAEYSNDELLQLEEEALGFSLAPDVMEAFEPNFDQDHSILRLNDVLEQKVGARIKTIAKIKDVRVIQTRKEELMAFLTLAYQGQEVSIVVFPKIYRQVQQLLSLGEVIGLEGKIDLDRRQQKQVIALKIQEAKTVVKAKSSSKELVPNCFIRIQDFTQDQLLIEKVKRIILAHPGPSPVIIVDQAKNTIQLDHPYKVSYSDRTKSELYDLLGHSNVVYH